MIVARRSGWRSCNRISSDEDGEAATIPAQALVASTGTAEGARMGTVRRRSGPASGTTRGPSAETWETGLGAAQGVGEIRESYAVPGESIFSRGLSSHPGRWGVGVS